MRLSDFDFPFDPSLVAHQPVEPRDRARLLVLPKPPRGMLHKKILDLPELLVPGDLLVVNNTKVLPVRFRGKKLGSGGGVDLVLVRELSEGMWEVFLRGKVAEGQVLELGEGTRATIHRRSERHTIVSISGSKPVPRLIQDIGAMPLPPYIKRAPEVRDRDWYQTVFAKHEGAIAAPTAGLHFTAPLLRDLQEQGVNVADLTLHVGPGTFLPVKTEEIDQHRMMPEWFEVPLSTVEAIQHTKQRGGRVIAIGTTVVRGLETAVNQLGQIMPYSGETNLFITPGFRFQVVDLLLTNFHLPRTTLFMLVSAFAGLPRMREAYAEAVRERYRFFSYGDAMLIM